MTPRRQLLLGALALAPLAAGRARASTLPDRATLLTPGPEEGEAIAWANRAAMGLTRGLSQAVAARVSPLGGPDGMTAANRFATLDGTDGRSLLVMPGAASQARLAGDVRVRYEPAEWVPVCCHWQSGLLVGRGWLRGNRLGPVKLGITSQESADCAALLALDLMGIEAVPVMVPTGFAREQAFMTGVVDAFVTSDLPRARVMGAEPWLDLHVPGLPSEPHAGVPRLDEIAPRGQAEMVEAAQAAFANERLRYALVLQRLTPGDIVAAWRHASLRWAEEVARDAVREGLMVGAEAADSYGALCPPTHVMQLYREWQLRRFARLPVAAPAEPRRR